MPFIDSATSARTFWRDDDGTEWEVLGPVGGDASLDTEVGYVYSARPYPVLGYGTAGDGPRQRVRRPQTAAERADSARRSAAYARAMAHVESEWKSLVDELNKLLGKTATASMWQTGGMCMAIGWCPTDVGPEATVMVTIEQDTLPHDRADADMTAERNDAGELETVRRPQRFMVGAYRDEDESMEFQAKDGRALCAAVDGTVAHDPSKDAEAARLIVETAERLFAGSQDKATT